MSAPPYRKKLIEVALPLKAINQASAREKSIRHGHPSTLHLWWARRPLAACRAVLFASLVDDPDSDPVYRRADGTVDEDRAGLKRAELFNLIEELVKWENSNNPRVINAARAEIARCVAGRKIETGQVRKDQQLGTVDSGQSTVDSRQSTADRESGSVHCAPSTVLPYTPWDILTMRATPAQVNHFLAEYAPPVLDPFCGGGSIPLEAQRLGLRAYGSDLNPVPVLITKALIEIPPKFAGRPPVNPEARKEYGEKRKEHALSGADCVAEGDAGGARGLSAGPEASARGDIRDAVADHPGDGVDPREHRGGLGTRIDEGKGAVPGDRAGLAGGSGDAADALRRPEVVSSRRNSKSAGAAARSQSHADDDETEREERGLRKEKRAGEESEPLSSFLFSRSFRGAEGLAEDVRYYGKWMRDEAEKRIGHLYPKVKVTKDMAKDRPDLQPYVGQDLTVIAWLWARTVPSPNPAVGGAHVPLVRSFWLSTKKGKEAWVRPVIDRNGSSWRFEVGVGKPPADFDPGTGTIGRKGGRCILTGAPMGFPHVRSEGQAGRMKQRLMAIVTEGTAGRVYISPIESHDATACSAQPPWKPDAALPDNPRDFKTPNYGMRTFADLFTPRQLVALTTFSDLVQEARAKVLADAQRAGLSADERPLADGGTGPQAYADAVATYLAFANDKYANYGSSLCAWATPTQKMVSTFGRQALPMVWDYAEANPLSESSGNWWSGVDQAAKSLDAAPSSIGGDAKQLDATAAINGVGSPMISTDPPYYDNIGYSDLSDFFYVWLRRSLKDVYPSLFATALTPKAQELIATPYRHGGDKQKAQEFFETGLGKAFARMHEAHASGFPLTVYYAFKQQEEDDTFPGARASRPHDEEEAAETAALPASTGWETMLTGLIRSGFAITGTWPMRTELVGNLKKNVSALASSIVLVCRPRPADARLATRKEFITALRQELPEALKNLQHGNIAPVDMAQSAIGPGMAVFTRYAKVIESDGSPMTVRTALGIINQVLDEVLAEQEGDFDADTRWALAWFDQFGVEEGQFGIAETLSKAKNTAVNALVEAGIVKSKAGKVRLLRRDELPDDWDPATDSRLRHWEVVQHLIHTLETKGETEAAKLLNRLGGMGETARELAYRLYSICERKKWADEALAYNSLVIAWPELAKLALRSRQGTVTSEQGLFELTGDSGQ